MKKAWKKPELTVLVRTRPEEAILGGCKTGVIVGDPNGTNTTCYENLAGPCPNCDNIATS